ncbi:NAD-dependent deacetylase [compost metagenome]
MLGSSLKVSPANQLPYEVLSRGGRYAIINNDPTDQDTMADLVINDDIIKTLKAVDEELYKL